MKDFADPYSPSPIKITQSGKRDGRFYTRKKSISLKGERKNYIGINPMIRKASAVFSFLLLEV